MISVRNHTVERHRFKPLEGACQPGSFGGYEDLIRQGSIDERFSRNVSPSEEMMGSANARFHFRGVLTEG